MKNNSKNRKLKFIRTKNWLRKGLVSFYVIGKLSNEFIENYESNIDNFLIKQSLMSLLNNYNLVFNKFKSKVEVGYNNDDFIKDIKTYRVEIRRTF